MYQLFQLLSLIGIGVTVIFCSISLYMTIKSKQMGIKGLMNGDKSLLKISPEGRVEIMDTKMLYKAFRKWVSGK